MSGATPGPHKHLAHLAEPLETVLRLVAEHEAAYQQQQIKLNELESHVKHGSNTSHSVCARLRLLESFCWQCP